MTTLRDLRSVRHLHVLLVGCFLAGALVLRLPSISEPSIEQRETQSALLARQWYLGDGSELPGWKRRTLIALEDQIKPIEPPILDFVAASAFRVTGAENFWVPRLISALLWVVGGVFLYLIAIRITSRAGAVVALGLYLVWPYGVWHSRLFMPDAMMIFFLLAASLAVIRYWERPSRARLVAAGAVSSVATAVKPGVAFLFLVALFVAIAAIHRDSFVATLLRGRLAAFVAMTVALPALYYVSGAYLSDFIAPNASTRRVTPDLLVSSSFWSGWWDVVSHLLRFPQSQELLALLPLGAGIAGIFLAPRGVPRAVLGGLSVGYLAFALAFANYTSTHPYYSLALIPILALAIGVLAGIIWERSGRWASYVRPAVVVLIALVLAGAVYKSHAVLTGGDPHVAIADYRRIGELTGHTTRAIVVDDQLATPGMYWGWTVGKSWELDYNDRLPPWIDPNESDFLIVVGVGQLETSQGLREFAGRFPVIARTSRYAIFDLRA